MIFGVGTDIVEIARIARALDRWQERFAAKILSDDEINFFGNRVLNPGLIARQFAAKEAVSKALQTGMRKGVHFRNIVVLRASTGAPQVTLTDSAQLLAYGQCIEKIHLSISDEKDYAIAYAVAECGAD
jgi:holo-[acyl-carrier protein] synthase